MIKLGEHAKLCTLADLASLIRLDDIHRSLVTELAIVDIKLSWTPPVPSVAPAVLPAGNSNAGPQGKLPNPRLPEAMPHPLELWPIKKVCTTLGYTRTHIYRLVKAGKLPKPVKAGRLNKWPARVIVEIVEKGMQSGKLFET